MTKQASLITMLTVTTFLCSPSAASSLNLTLNNIASLPSNAFTYSEGSESDYDFIVQEASEKGALTNKYYKITILQDNFSAADNISWEQVAAEGENTIKLELPDGKEQYFKYTYTDTPNRQKYDSSQSALTGAVDADFIGAKSIYSGGGGINNSKTLDNVNGSFVSNFANAYGGAINNNGTIGNITGEFIANDTGRTTSGSKGEGGAIYNKGKIGNVNADFIGNNAGNTTSGGNGGAIFNYSETADITGKFIANTAVTGGGAIYNNNNGIMGNITGDFISNSVTGTNSIGGAIYNRSKGSIKEISGDFISNSAKIGGGAIYNQYYGEIDTIRGNFVENSAGTKGGAIYNEGNVNKINGNFIANAANGAGSEDGAALYNGGNGKIDSISGNFNGNITSGYGAAIKNAGSIGDISANFIANSSAKDGGAIYNNMNKTIGNITGDFIGNSAIGNGGAIYGKAGSVFGTVSGNFINNSAQNAGGAMYVLGNMNFASGSDTLFMSGNHTNYSSHGKIYNAILGNTTSEFTIDTSGGGAWVINDNLRNGIYKFTGDDTVDANTGITSQYVAVNNDIINVKSVTVDGTTLRFDAYQQEDQNAKNWDGKGSFAASLNSDGSVNRDADAVTSLTLNNAAFLLANGYQDIVKLNGYSATNSFLHVDVNPDNMTADELHISGDVQGTTKMIVHSSSDTDIRGKGGILFAQSENDTTGNADSFLVSRVYGSPYMFDVQYNSLGNNANKWDLVMNDNTNPDKDNEADIPEIPDIPNFSEIQDDISGNNVRKTAPEIMAYQALPIAALEQTKGMASNINRQVQGSRLYCPGCGFYDYFWNGKPFKSVWADAVSQTSKNDGSVDVDATVHGFEAGGSFQQDLYNKLGLFLSYRNGNYDMNGNGKQYYSELGSKIDIESFLAGLYYRYDHQNLWIFATLFGGIQKADIKTDDGITSDTDGIELGGNIELGYDYALSKLLYITPSAGIFYTQVDYDDASDDAGKTAEYALLRQLEIELGVKLTQMIEVDDGYANVYIRPLIIQTFNGGDNVRITGLRKTSVLKNQTLGRIEVGGRYGFSDYLSAYGWANYTFGSNYTAAALGLGMNYNW